MKRAITIALILAGLLAAVLIALVGPRGQDKGPLVLAASSLQESLHAVADAWQAEGHARPVLSFAATPALARQIEAGAPADLFISADQQWMDELARKDLIRHRTRTTLLGNTLVLVEQAGKDTSLVLEPGAALAVALGGGKLAMAEPETVPAGRYAKQTLVSLEVWSGVSDRIVRTENVRIAAALVGQGEAALGIVYRTDALAEPKLRIVATFPEASHVPITYPVARLKASGHSDADAFLQFLLSEEARAIFRQFGFETGPEQ